MIQINSQLKKRIIQKAIDFSVQSQCSIRLSVDENIQIVVTKNSLYHTIYIYATDGDTLSESNTETQNGEDAFIVAKDFTPSKHKKPQLSELETTAKVWEVWNDAKSGLPFDEWLGEQMETAQ